MLSGNASFGSTFGGGVRFTAGTSSSVAGALTMVSGAGYESGGHLGLIGGNATGGLGGETCVQSGSAAVGTGCIWMNTARTTCISGSVSWRSAALASSGESGHIRLDVGDGSTAGNVVLCTGAGRSENCGFVMFASGSAPETNSIPGGDLAATAGDGEHGGG